MTPKNCFQNKLVFPIASSSTNTRKDSSTDTSNSLIHLKKMAERENISSFSFLLVSPQPPFVLEDLRRQGRGEENTDNPL